MYVAVKQGYISRKEKQSFWQVFNIKQLLKTANE